MAITIADIRFEYHDYDKRGDTLFLSVGTPDKLPPSDTYDTPEGHCVELDDSGSIRAIELIDARRLLDRDGQLRLTLHGCPAVASASQLAPALV
jgi:uncharacterized protein YuzE